MIDINKPLEIVHIDGRVEVATFCKCDSGGDIYTKEMVKEGKSEFVGIWKPEGSSWSNCTPSWRLRNVQKEHKRGNAMTIEFKPIGSHKIVRTGVYGKPKSRIRIALEEIKVGQEFFHIPNSASSLKVMACKIGKARGIRISVRECGEGFVVQAYEKDKERK